MRKHISKALQTRSQAIRTAVDKYNAARARLPEPRPEELSVKQVLDYVFVAEFDLLRDSRCSVQDQPWARPAAREATACFFKLKRSQEEIVRLRVEIARLLVFIEDADAHSREVLAHLADVSPALAVQLRKRVDLQSAQSELHIARLSRLYDTYSDFCDLDLSEAKCNLWNTQAVGPLAGRTAGPTNQLHSSRNYEGSSGRSGVGGGGEVDSNDDSDGDGDGNGNGNGNGNGDGDGIDQTIDVLDTFVE